MSDQGVLTEEELLAWLHEEGVKYLESGEKIKAPEVSLREKRRPGRPRVLVAPVPVQVWVEVEEKEAFRQACKNNKTGMSQVVRQLIGEYIREHTS